MTARSTLSDTATLRRRAESHLEDGALTAGYRADRDRVVELLNTALATELVCVLRYKRHHFLAAGLQAEPAAAEFLEHAREEQDHADRLAARIVQLGGEPDFSPRGLQDRSHAEYGTADTLEGMLRENLVAERLAIESYGEMIRFVGEDDPTTRRLLEDLLAVEEEHADDLAGLREKAS